MSDSLSGRLLVATPLLHDPNFSRTVVLVVEHGDQGAAGVVLNRPSDTTVAEALPEWAPLATQPDVVFVGGPVQPGAVVCLARGALDGAPDGFEPVVGDTGALDLRVGVEQAAGRVDAIRLFSGYAGWSPRQLEDEIAEDAWFVVDARAGDALTSDPEGLWRSVLRRQPGELALFASYPPEPALN